MKRFAAPPRTPEGPLSQVSGGAAHREDEAYAFAASGVTLAGERSGMDGETVFDLVLATGR